ncbi:hypothetical protein D7D52_20515 [Nocardia yunnanensis]|uniref:Phage holin family protein n=1 Tax=Nocardia yunnanensis TaxID=2382165 RepID=A0A386ZDU2_9NOCA|nr:phage holin family protein [Nocardia yunnanensis]AYF75831.1 hypothetical protein D7D52_20515 [Nocardia yunnanensis]
MEMPGKFDPTSAVSGLAGGAQLNTMIRQQFEAVLRETLFRKPRFSQRMKLNTGAALLGLYGGGLVAAVILLLALAIPAWASALIVGAVLLGAAAVVRTMAKSRSAESPVSAVDPRG